MSLLSLPDISPKERPCNVAHMGFKVAARQSHTWLFVDAITSVLQIKWTIEATARTDYCSTRRSQPGRAAGGPKNPRMAIFPSFGNLKGGELWTVYLFIVSLGKFIFSLGDETDIRAIPSPTLYTPSQRYPCTVCAATANGRCCGHKNHILSSGHAAHGSICALVMEPHPCESSSTRLRGPLLAPLLSDLCSLGAS